MNGTKISLAAAIAVAFLVTGASAQQGGAPKTPSQPTGATHKSSHVSRDICATHPNLPQCAS
jgi:hypothetical protein